MKSYGRTFPRLYVLALMKLSAQCYFPQRFDVIASNKKLYYLHLWVLNVFAHRVHLSLCFVTAAIFRLTMYTVAYA
uniref:Uncharacterized protein n=1 Tax=Rhipicephalus microplus TaxID=6941 RepID=A0A6G5A0W7_RHIMP